MACTGQRSVQLLIELLAVTVEPRTIQRWLHYNYTLIVEF